jgi:hypothetical protein
MVESLSDQCHDAKCDNAECYAVCHYNNYKGKVYL